MILKRGCGILLLMRTKNGVNPLAQAVFKLIRYSEYLEHEIQCRQDTINKLRKFNKDNKIPLQKWEGCVLWVDDEAFVARLEDLTNPNNPTEEATLPLEEVGPTDRELLNRRRDLLLEYRVSHDGLRSNRAGVDDSLSSALRKKDMKKKQTLDKIKIIYPTLFATLDFLYVSADNPFIKFKPKIRHNTILELQVNGVRQLRIQEKELFRILDQQDEPHAQEILDIWNEIVDYEMKNNPDYKMNFC